LFKKKKMQEKNSHARMGEETYANKKGEANIPDEKSSATEADLQNVGERSRKASKLRKMSTSPACPSETLKIQPNHLRKKKRGDCRVEKSEWSED